MVDLATKDEAPRVHDGQLNVSTDLGFTPGRLERDAPVYVAGHRGLVGSAIWRKLETEGFTRLIGRTSAELDLKDRSAVFEFFEQEKPEYVFLAAAKVGGILANNTYPADFLSENLQIQVNVMDAAVRFGVRRLMFLGSSCIYPKFAPQPITESALLQGDLEPTNDAYAIAKIAWHPQRAGRPAPARSAVDLGHAD